MISKTPILAQSEQYFADILQNYFFEDFLIVFDFFDIIQESIFIKSF